MFFFIFGDFPKCGIKEKSKIFWTQKCMVMHVPQNPKKSKQRKEKLLQVVWGAYLGARVHARDEEINSIDKKAKEKRGKKKSWNW
jgi:uncharacterized metal-binding protein